MVFWLELLKELGDEFNEIAALHNEAEQILKIVNNIRAKLKKDIE